MVPKLSQDCRQKHLNNPAHLFVVVKLHVAKQGRPHKTENKVRLGFKDHWTQRKRSRIRLQLVLQKARTEIPPLVAEVSRSFMASLVRPSTRRTESLSYSIFRFVCV